MPRLGLITMPSLNRALQRVAGELRAHGFYADDVASLPVWLDAWPRLDTYGYWDGEIHVPAVTLDRVRTRWFGGSYTSLADVLRHEYGHAVADLYPRLLRSRRFRDAFATHHDDEAEQDYDPALHVSTYAATNASEDWAEVFMSYHRCRGRLPARWSTTAIRAKWRFVAAVGDVVRLGRRRWP
jgi:hypothetical protein